MTVECGFGRIGRPVGDEPIPNIAVENDVRAGVVVLDDAPVGVDGDIDQPLQRIDRDHGSVVLGGHRSGRDPLGELGAERRALYLGAIGLRHVEPAVRSAVEEASQRDQRNE